jgi:hypothetical protein
MSEPFLSEMSAAELSRIRMALQRKGVSFSGAGAFLAGKLVSNSADRLTLAAILIAHETSSHGISKLVPQATARVGRT